MPVSEHLQTIVADVSAMIATGEAPRCQLEKLRRNLDAARRDARTVETDAFTARAATRTLIEGVEEGVANLAGLAQRTREQAGIAA